MEVEIVLMEVEIVLMGVEKGQKGALWASFGSDSWGRGKYSVNLQVKQQHKT